MNNKSSKKLNIYYMKKIMLVFTVLITLSISILTFSSFTSISSDEDETTEIEPNTDFWINADYYNSGTQKIHIQFCPGTGAPCNVAVWGGGSNFNVSGFKTLGGPDYKIFW